MLAPPRIDWWDAARFPLSSFVLREVCGERGAGSSTDTRMTVQRTLCSILRLRMSRRSGWHGMAYIARFWGGGGGVRLRTA
eukprot:302710-Rhodomonas_salina.1